jgi:hypothetical protein
VGMQIYVQKLSVPSEEWPSLDVESSDTIEGVKSKLSDAELPAVYDVAKIHLFFDGAELQNNDTLSSYNIQKNDHLTSTYENDPYARWGGFNNYKRLKYLEYL